MVDAILLVLAALFAQYLWFGYLPSMDASTVAAILPLVFLRLVLLHIYELYDFEYHCEYFNMVYTLVAVMFWSTLFNLAALFLPALWQAGVDPERGAFVEPGTPLVDGLIGLVLMVAWRSAYLYWIREIKKIQSRVLIVGAGSDGRRLGRDIEMYSPVVHKVVGYVEESGAGSGEGVLGPPEDVERIIRENEVSMVIVTWHRTRLISILDCCARLNIRARLMPDLSEVVLGQVQISQIAGVPLIELKTLGKYGWFATGKRISDLFFAVLFSVPILVISPFVALAIHLDSPGPVLFRQERVGWRGRHFFVHKFRTMVEDAEAKVGPVLSSRDDPRVTRVGRFLRRTRLDELPQIINILRGEMSVVGPRPERPHFVEDFMRQFPSYSFRHMVRPGMTGLAQIYGRYDSSAEQKLRYDLAYINNLSFFVDLRILAKTFRRALTGSRAR
jgi:exopolysaccharide biosynthesis polyprenyl glycosylphosphotransferase